MDFARSRRQEDVVRRAKRFVEDHVQAEADHWDKSSKFPSDAWRALARAGLAGVPIPRKYGGAGEDAISYAQVVEEISRASAALGVTLAVHVSLVSQPLLSYGTEKQKMRHLKPLARGAQFGSFCLTEPGAGSDVVSMESKAVPDEDGYVITGRKYFIVNAPLASTFLVFAMTDKSLAHRGMSCFIVKRDMQRLMNISDPMAEAFEEAELVTHVETEGKIARVVQDGGYDAAVGNRARVLNFDPLR